VSYYESRIKALEARIEEMAQLERMKAVKVEAQLMITISELQVENARLKAQVERLTKAGDAMAIGLQGMAGERPKALADEWNDAKGVNP
jgi:hypothetical protein